MAKKKPAERAHALLSASSAARWLACTASPRIEEGFPDTTSESAAEGTLAHAIGELKLRSYYEVMAKATRTRAMNKLMKDPLYKDEMQRYTDEYLEYIQSITFGLPPGSQAYTAIEKRVDYSKYAPEGFGTADCLIIHGDTLWVVDFKYGKNHAVYAEDNPQMKLYALGALEAYGFLYPIEQVKMCIFQPRIHGASEAELDVATLQQWGEEVVKPLAEEAYGGTENFVPGDHCTFCRAKAVCRAYAADYDIDEAELKDTGLMTLEEVSRMLTKLDGVTAYYNALKTYALNQALLGKEIPDYKVVAGRSTRAFKDIDAVFEKVKAAGFDESVLYERKPLTLTGIEALLGKSDFNKLLADDVIKPPGKPTLVSADDKREAYTGKTSAEDDFKNIQL